MTRKRLLLLSGLITIGIIMIAANQCPYDPKPVTEPDSACVNAPRGQNGSDQTCAGSGNPHSGGGGGGGGNPTPTNTAVPTATNTPVPTPTPSPQQTPVPPFNFVPYTFNSQYCQSSDNFVDPINVVFVGNATWQNVQTHAADHGGWGNNSGSTQWFQEVGTCLPMQGQSASGSWFTQTIAGRFHMRYRQSSGLIAGYGVVSVADAHHEDVVINVDGCGAFNHVTDHNDDNGGVSGFDMGKQDIIDNWGIGGSGHTPLSSFRFNNTIPLRQCDGRYSWSSDGRAVIVPVP